MGQWHIHDNKKLKKKIINVKIEMFKTQDYSWFIIYKKRK